MQHLSNHPVEVTTPIRSSALDFIRLLTHSGKQVTQLTFRLECAYQNKSIKRSLFAVGRMFLGSLRSTLQALEVLLWKVTRMLRGHQRANKIEHYSDWEFGDRVKPPQHYTPTTGFIRAKLPLITSKACLGLSKALANLGRQWNSKRPISLDFLLIPELDIRLIVVLKCRDPDIT